MTVDEFKKKKFVLNLFFFLDDADSNINESCNNNDQMESEIENYEEQDNFNEKNNKHEQFYKKYSPFIENSLTLVTSPLTRPSDNLLSSSSVGSSILQMVTPLQHQVIEEKSEKTESNKVVIFKQESNQSSEIPVCNKIEIINDLNFNCDDDDDSDENENIYEVNPVDDGMMENNFITKLIVSNLNSTNDEFHNKRNSFASNESNESNEMSKQGFY